MKNKKYFTLLLVLLLCNTLFSQTEEELANYKKTYPNDYVVDIKNSKSYLIDIIKDSLHISTKKVQERFFIDEFAAKNRGDDISYGSFTEIKNISAYTLVPNGKSYKKSKVKEFKTKDVLDNSIFFDDNKEIIFEYPNLREGCKVYLSYTEITKSPYMVGSFFFGNYVPMENSFLEIKAHKDVAIGYQLYNTDTANLTYSFKEEKGYKIHRWEVKKINSFAHESGAPNPRYFLPHIVFYIKSYTIKGTKKNVTESLNDLHRWYYSLLQTMKKSDNEELKLIVDSITQNIDKEEDKVREIFYWVQENIKYIAFEDGMNGFVPEEASKVCSNKYGDCKGNASIIVEMLNLAGIEGYFTWVGSRAIPYKYTELPSVFTDNHMIAAYKKGEEYIFLDATGDHLPFGMPSGFIQGKEALINLGKGKFTLQTVPIIGQDINFCKDSITIEIDDKTIIGKGKITFDGYYKINYSRYLTGLSEKDTKHQVESFVKKGNNKFELKDFEIFNLGEKDKPLIITYNFILKDYLHQNGKEYYLNMNIEKVFADEKIKKERTIPIEDDFYGIYTLHTKLILPEKSSIEYLPENSTYNHELFRYAITYNKTENAVSSHHIWDTNYLILQQEHFEEWNKMIKKLKKAYNESIIIKNESIENK